jgi:hypothetical protein
MRFSTVVFLMLLAAFMASCDDETNDGPLPPIGRCGTYVDYSGVATILSVEPTGASGPSSPSCYHGYKVLFELSDDISRLCSESLGYFNNNVWTFTLANSWAPGPAYIDKYHIEAGAKFDCVLRVQRSGPCTPCIIDLEGVDPNDYFECR